MTIPRQNVHRMENEGLEAIEAREKKYGDRLVA